MTIAEEKKALRNTKLVKRARLPRLIKKEYDQWICDSLWQTIQERDCKTVHCYLPMGTEINITPLIEKLLEENITVIVPKTLPKPKMQNLVLTSLDNLDDGVFGTKHPTNAEEFLGIYDLIIVPGLAFDDANYRLGYGGAYYDNFLVHHPNTSKIGIFYPFQQVEKVPVESHDVQLNEIRVNKDFVEL
ncbi:MAG: 5-formyltetrahydrofolate cyclo-ligase [Flavobacteriaceae bacterium]|nr:5-formyltetrahydrofolate cyclo-ligase [Flavobacteriaceae bacterium]